MNKEIRNKIEPILYWLTNLSLACIIYFSYSYYSAISSDYSDYFEYDSITTTKDKYSIWEDIFSTSSLYRERPIYMVYNDILRCDLWEDYTWFSSATTYSKKVRAVWDVLSGWRYEGDLPKTPANCFIDSYPSVLLDFGIKKTQNIRSNDFIIK